MPTPVFNPEVPFSQEAEEAAIGSVLVNPTVFITVSAFLSPEDFFLLRHNRIWQAFLRLSERREAIDYLTVAEELKAMKMLDEIGGYPYLIQVMNNTPTSVHAEVYARLVERTAVRRRMLEAADKMRALALDEVKNIETVLSEAEDAFYALRPNSDVHTRSAFDAISDYYDQLQFIWANKIQLGMPTGFRDLDQITQGVKRGDLTIVGARPGMGKTSMLLTVALNQARMGLRVTFFTLEMKTDELINRLLSIDAGVNSQKIRTPHLTPQESARITEAAGRISELPIQFNDASSMSPAQLRAEARRIKYQQGLDVLFVDYLQLMNPNQAVPNMRHVEIGQISRALKELAKELDIPVIAAAQLSRAVEQRRDKRPIQSDLRESGSIESDADNILFIYRDEVYNEATEFPNQVDIIVAKQRNGSVGTVSLYFEKTLTKFMDANVHRVDLSDME